MEIRGQLPGPIEFVAIGHVAVDLRDGERVLGGAAAYGCLAAARLGRASANIEERKDVSTFWAALAR